MLLLGTAASTLCCRWEDKDNREAAVDPDSQYLTAPDIVNLVRTLVLSTYVKNGKHIRKQIKGLPMGTNPAGHLADIHCHRKESAAIDQLAQADPQQAQSWNLQIH